MEIVRQINLDVSRANVFAPIDVKQSDKKSRFLDVTITDRGVAKVVPQDATVIINVKRPDGVAKGFSGSVKTDGTLRVPVPAWALQMPGDITCDVSIISGEERLTTMGFTLRAQRAAYAGDDVTADENYDILTELIDKASGYSFYIDLAGNYPNYTCPVPMDDIKAAYNSGKNLVCRCQMGAYTATLPLFIPMPAANTWIFSGSGALEHDSMNFKAQLFTIAITANGVVAQNTLLARNDGALPNPHELMIAVGDTTYNYDGSETVNIVIDDGTEVGY